MAVQDVVLAGFGSTGTVQLIVLSGFGGSAAAAVAVSNSAGWAGVRKRKRKRREDEQDEQPLPVEVVTGIVPPPDELRAFIASRPMADVEAVSRPNPMPPTVSPEQIARELRRKKNRRLAYFLLLGA